MPSLRERRRCPSICGIIYITHLRPALLFDQARHQAGELEQIGDTEQPPALPDDDLGLGADDVGPLPWHRAELTVVDAQQQPRPVPDVPLADADEPLSAQGMERVGHAHKMRARVRSGCSSW